MVLLSEDTVPLISDDTLAENAILTQNQLEAQTSSQHGLPKKDSAESSGVPEMKMYKRRWYILILFSALACHQCTVWNTWGPIASSVQAAY